MGEREAYLFLDFIREMLHFPGRWWESRANPAAL